MLELLYNISQFLLLATLSFACGWGLKDIYIGIKEYTTNKRNIL